MHRITSWAYTAPLAIALACMEGLRPELLYFDVLTGTDPLWAGLHEYRDTGDGRSYRDTPHVAETHHQRLSARQQVPTIVLPAPRPPAAIIHEIGHVIHGHLGWRLALPANTEYAKTDRFEAFAESFTALFYPSMPLAASSRYALEQLWL